MHSFPMDLTASFNSKSSQYHIGQWAATEKDDFTEDISKKAVAEI